MRLAGLLLLVAGAAAAQEPRIMTCATEDGDDVLLSLGVPSDLGAPLHCVDAPVAGMEGFCAPNGGWGLLTSSGELSIATEPRGLEHDGYWFFSHLGPSQFVASASQGTEPPLTLEVAGETFWRMRLDLATGQGVMETRNGEARLTCPVP